MSKKLSRSACAKWMACPASFDYYYNQKIRPIKTGSALMFGSGIDVALNQVLTGSPNNPMDAYRIEVAKYPLGNITYGKYDFDHEMLSDEICAALLPSLKGVGYNGTDPVDLFSKLKAKQDAGEALSENQEKALDLIYRACFEAKAVLMIEAYRLKALPFIKKVHAVQKPSGPGYLDAIVEWEGRGKIIVDHKTAGRRYPDNAVEYSDQLAMYAAEEQIPEVAFVVLIKEIQKNRRRVCIKCSAVPKSNQVRSCDAEVDGERCKGDFKVTISPEADVQIIHGSVTPEMMAVAAELQREVQRATDAHIFPCNVGACNNQYGRPCEYRDLKWKGSMDGLEVYSRGSKK